MAKVPEAAVRIEQKAEMLTLHEWNSRRAKHHFCSRCGIHVFCCEWAPPDHFGVNVVRRDGVDANSLPVRAVEEIALDLVCEGPSIQQR